jgi:hypothetical protein
MHTPDDLRTVYLVWRFKATSLNGYEVTSYLRHTFMTSSIVSAIIIGCERSFAVRSPLKDKEKWTKKLTIKLYLVIYIVLLSFVVTRLIVSNIISVEYYKEHLYTPYFIIVRGIPFVIILTTNNFLIDGLNENSRRKQEMTSDSTERLRIKTETSVTKNSYDCYSCLPYLYGSKSYNGWSTFCLGCS